MLLTRFQVELAAWAHHAVVGAAELDQGRRGSHHVRSVGSCCHALSEEGVPALRGGQEVRRPRALAGWGPNLSI